ncbi:hypothetical protein CC80DRAFT_279064 [Byssothecium circinans]|uniref:RRM domain-containing protein n=1 Tax=Byssothecium circinans TaxID=147558 RepID=A0A6A5T984_9PLEO|nr:hypothetical protein CC80DRAFT_279064 [Byssothecium circinans]
MVDTNSPPTTPKPDTTATAQSAPASLEGIPNSNSMQATSPASDATVVDTTQAASPASDATVVVMAPRPSTLVGMPGMKGQPRSGAAIFSTDDGRMPARPLEGPILPPQIAHGGDYVFSVVLYAHMWRNKYPHYYHRFFPDKDWSIHDLWDPLEIHLQSTGFVEETLGFITRDNMFRVNQYASQWARQHPEKLDMIGGSLEGLYDIDNPLAIVDKFFTDGETSEYPPEFLWHVGQSMRVCMKAVSDQMKKNDTNIDEANNVQQSGPSAMSASRPRKPACAFLDGLVQMLTYCTDEAHTSPPMVPAATSSQVLHPPAGVTSLPTHVMPFEPMRPFNSYPNQPGRLPFGDPIPAPISMAPPHPNGQLRNPKNRFNRQDSGSAAYSHHPQGYGWGDNVRIPSDQSMRQPSGATMHRQPTRHPSNMSAAPGFMNNMSPMGSPNMYHSQIVPPHMIPHGIIPPQPTQFGPPLMEPPYPMYGPNGPVPRVMPFGDMTNGMQHPLGRGMEQRGIVERRGSMASNPASRLFDPFGDRPEQSKRFTQIPNIRKGGRNSFSGSSNRPRKYSNGRYGSNNYDRDDGPRSSSGYYSERPSFGYGPANESVVNDKESGCDAQSIAPKNESVRKLYVTNLPNNVSEPELLAVFQAKAGVSRVEMKMNPGMDYFTHAFVFFNSPNEARKCLPNVSKFELRGKTLAISVPYCYYRVVDVPFPAQGPQRDGRPAPLITTNSTVGLGEVADRPQYSPQDARSDLQKNRHSQQSYPLTKGSPRERKSTTRDLPVDQGNLDEKREVESKSEMTTNLIKVVQEDPFVQEAKALNEAGGVDQQPIIAELPSEPVVKGSQQPKEHSEVEEATISAGQGLDTSTVHVLTQEVAADLAAPLSPVSEHSITEDVADLAESPALSPPSKSSPSSQSLAAAASIEPVPLSIPPLTESPNLIAAPSLSTKTPEKTKAYQNKDDGATVSAKSPRMQDETSSDDDQKHDLSFHSAQEAQDESTAATNDDITTPIPIKSEEPQIDTMPPFTPIEAKPDDPQAKIILPDPNQSTSQAGKKPGAKQTQSLNPFAKPSKAQKQKEKQAKKKEKKKEKIKVEKEVAPATRSGSATNSKSEGSALKSKVEDSIAQTETKSNESVDEAEAQQTTVVQRTKSPTVGGIVSGGTSSGTFDSNPPRQTHTVPDRTSSTAAGVTAVPMSQDLAQTTNDNLQQTPKRKSHHISKIAVPVIGPVRKSNLPVPSTSPGDNGSATMSGSSTSASPTGVMNHGPEASTHDQGE